MDIIQFPNLFGGLEFSINRVAFTIGPLSVYWYGIIIAAGFALAVILGIRSSKKYDVDPDDIIDVVLFATPAAIIFARLFYVIFKWDEITANGWTEIFKIWHGGLMIYGGVIGAVIAAFLVTRVKGLSTLKVFDFGAPYLVLGQAIGRWGNLINQEAFGTNTNLPWGMTGDKIRYDIDQLYIDRIDPNIPVHPTFLYESLWDFGIFLFLIWYRKRKKHNGEVFFLYMILYGVGRFWIEGLRADSLMLGNLRISQVLALVFAITLAVVFYMRRQKLALAAADESVELGTSEYGELVMQMKTEEAEAMENSADASDEPAGQGEESENVPEAEAIKEEDIEAGQESGAPEGAGSEEISPENNDEKVKE